MTRFPDFTRVLVIGLGATAVLDIWLAFLGSVGVPTMNFAYLGRWLGHLFRGRFAHAAIAHAQPIRGELAWGWFLHYAIGIAFAALLVCWQGEAWLQQPSLGPALAVGIGTVLAPLLVLQPVMGAGFASSRTPAPVKNTLRSLLNHAVFGLGLYGSSLLAAQFLR